MRKTAPSPVPDPRERAFALGQRWLDAAARAAQAGLPAQAEADVRRALRALRRGLGPTDANLAPALCTLGHLRAERDDAAGACRSYAHAITLLRPLRRDPEARALELEARLGLAHALIERARYPQATLLLRETRPLTRRWYGADALELAAALNAHGKLCKYTARFGPGLRSYRRALEIVRVKAPGEDLHRALLHNLGGIHHARGDLAAALPFARQALAMAVAIHGPDSLEAAVEGAALAPVLEGLGQVEEAAALLRQAAAVFRREGRTYDLAVALHNLAPLEPAPEACYREALALKQALFGAEHPDVAMTVHDLGVFLADRDPAQARDLVERALAIFQARLGPRHPHTAAAARTLRTLGQGEERRPETG